eukprot:1196058-Prorocentrum_minimum.AAC.2
MASGDGNNKRDGSASCSDLKEAHESIANWNIQGTFREHSENIQGTFREHSENIQGTFSKSSIAVSTIAMVVLTSVETLYYVDRFGLMSESDRLQQRWGVNRILTLREY